MLVTAFLLGLLYVVFTAVLIVLIKSAVLAILVAGGLLFAQYWFSDRIALYAMNGRVVSAQNAPELHGVVDRLCALADLPKPAVAIAMFAFHTLVHSEDGVVGFVTNGMYGDLQSCGIGMLDVLPHACGVRQFGTCNTARIRRIQIRLKEQSRRRSK